MKGIQLTLEEKQLLIEALLFSSHADICAEWTPKQNLLMVELANKLNEPNIKLNNIYLWDTGIFEGQELAEYVKKTFNNLPLQSIITD
jgi:hypothetical protein